LPCWTMLAFAIALTTGRASATSIAEPDMGKLLATGGVSQVEGAGGGGLTPWALITGYGSEDSYGANTHVTQLNTQDYSLKSYGISLGLLDRFELSLAKQEFSGSLAPLNQLRIDQDILGIKFKIAGDAIYGQDTWLPQLAVGAMYKQNNGIEGLQALGVNTVQQLGAKSAHGIDYYLSATKIFLAQSLLLNTSFRLTKANQMGLLGFGGDKNNQYRLMPEFSVAYLLQKEWVLGAEYRKKPANLSVDNEKNYGDIFLAYFPSKHWSVTAAYADLGDITIFNPTRQHGLYLSIQAGY
jgi:hypothetical protein